MEIFNPPPLATFMPERAFHAKSSFPPPPPFSVEEKEIVLSLGSLAALMPTAAPKEPYIDHRQSDSETSMMFSTNESLVVSNKIDKDSEKGFWLFGVCMKTQNSFQQEHVMEDNQSASGAAVPLSTDESMGSEESTQVFADKYDEKRIRVDSRKGFSLFESHNSSLQEVGNAGSEKKLSFGDQERSAKKRDFDGLPDPENPFKKRALSEDFGVVKMTKVLTDSDVNASCRLLLGRKSEFIDQLLRHLNVSMEQFEDTNHGEEVKVFDSDIRRETNLVLKRWATKSFVFNNGWNQNFVDMRNLKKGDVIELTWDEAGRRLNFSVAKRASELQLLI